MFDALGFLALGQLPLEAVAIQGWGNIPRYLHNRVEAGLVMEGAGFEIHPPWLDPVPVLDGSKYDVSVSDEVPAGGYVMEPTPKPYIPPMGQASGYVIRPVWCILARKSQGSKYKIGR